MEESFDLVTFDTDEGECEVCGYSTHNSWGQRIKCECDYVCHCDEMCECGHP